MRQLLLIVLLLSTSAFGQLWNGVIDPSRASDWSTAGVQGGIPSSSWANCTTTACNTLWNNGVDGTQVTAANINSALSSAGAIATTGAPLVVRIPGNGTTRTMSTCIDHEFSNVVLRGQGANLTKLTFTGSCNGGGLGYNRAINLISGAAGTGQGAASGGSDPSHVTSWTAGYAVGTTVITLATPSGCASLSSCGLTAGAAGTGSVILLDQLDDGSGEGYPTVNDVIQCATQAAWCSNQGGNNYARAGRAQIQVVTVTAINGNNLTITPAIAYPNYRSGKSPGAWWNNTQIHNSGLEDFSVDYTNAGSVINVLVKDGSNLWIKGLRSVNIATDTSGSFHFWIHNAAHVTVQSNYIWGKNTSCSPFPLENYALSDEESSDVLYENNILQHTNNPYVPNDPGGRTVFAYNLIQGSVIGAAGSQPHSGHRLMDLYEGNNWASYYGDVTHGSHSLMTFFRNHFDGSGTGLRNNSCTVGSAIAFLTNNRFNNAVGNVFGATSYSAYEVTTGTSSNGMFDIGTIGNNSGTTVSPDSNVKRTLFRWGNWDYLTSSGNTGTNDQTGTRWCASGHTGFTTTCGSVSEVPSGITSLANPVPATETLPASFYLNSRPAWFTVNGTTLAFPAVGFDVQSGNAPNTTTTPTGGHANKIPARVCWESLSNDPAYSSTLAIKVYSASTCYAAAGGSTFTLATTTTGNGAGTITGCAGTYAAGAAYSCTVTPTTGAIASVTGCGGSGTTTFSGTMPASNCTVTATFTQTLTTITVAPATTSLVVSGTQQFTAACFDQVAASMACPVLAWTSDATSVATVNSSGLATAIATGAANIRATSGSVFGQAAVAVAGTAVHGPITINGGVVVR